MRIVAALLLLVAATVADEPRAFVELVADHDEVYVHQPLRLTLRIGYDADYFKQFAVQLFQQRIDVPVHVDATDFDRSAAAKSGKTLALNDDVVYAALSDPRGKYTVFVLEQTLGMDEPGERTFAAPSLRYASGTKFREDFLHGRVATDRRDTVVDGESLKVRVLPIPDEGRPDDWAGAVGQLRIRTEVPQRSIDEDQTLELRLWVEGDGNIETIPIPDLEIAGFHIVGSLSSFRDGSRLITCTLRPLSADIDAVPAVALPYFDPTPPAQFRFARSEPISITVRANPTESATVDESYVEAYIIPGWMIGAGVLGVVALLLLAWRVTRRKDAGPSAALAHFESSAESDLVDALPAYLAASLDCPTATVISPDLKQRLVGAGASEQLAADTAALVEQLVGSRYGGSASAEDSLSRARELVATLEPIFHARHA